MAETPQKSKFKVANTSDPDSFKAGSPTNFDGILVSMFAYPYVGRESKDGRYYGFIGMRIMPDPDSGFDEFTKKVLGFYLNAAVPSKDGESPAGGTDDVYRMLSNGKAELDDKDGPCVDEQGHVKASHPNVGEYLLGAFIQDGPAHQLFDAFKDCDEKGEFIDHSLTSMNAKYAGLKCHFDLVQPRPRKGGKDKKDGKEGEDRLVLVPTKIHSKGNKVSGAGASVSSGKSSSASPGANGSGGADSLAPVIEKEILELLKTAPNNQLSIGDLMIKTTKSLIAKQLIQKGQKALVQAWIGDRQENPDGSPGLPVNLIALDGADWDPTLFDNQGGLELS